MNEIEKAINNLSPENLRLLASLKDNPGFVVLMGHILLPQISRLESVAMKRLPLNDNFSHVDSIEMGKDRGIYLLIKYLEKISDKASNHKTAE